MAEAESRARWDFSRAAVCREARRGLAPPPDEDGASPKAVRIASSGSAPWRPERWRRAFMEMVRLFRCLLPDG